MSGGEETGITSGELTRFMERMEHALATLGQRIDSALLTKVSTDRYEAEMAEVRRNQASTEADIKAMLGRQERWRLAVFTAIAAPIIVAVLLVVIATAYATGNG